MSVFIYQGKTALGKIVKGQLEAASEIEARVKLRAQRVIPIKVQERSVVQKAKGVNKNGDIMVMLGFEPTVKQKDLQIFTRQFATLINSGIPIVQSLDILGAQSSSLVLKNCLVKVKASVESGRRLYEAMDGYPKIFNRLYVSLVKAGEEGGVLDTILNRLAAYIEKAGKLKNKVVGAMWYPVAISAVAALVTTMLLTFVIPKFETIFSGAGQQLPALTQWVINASHFMKKYFFLVIIAVVVGIFSIIRYYNTPGGKDQIDAILINSPVFGNLIQKSAIARFTRTMSTMLSCGVGILDSLEICANVVGNSVVEKAIRKAKVAISEGKSITQPLSQEKYIPSMVVQMMGVGEATGTLDTMLGKIADFYEEEVDVAVGALTSIMEPIMMVVLGGIVAVLVIAMYLPIFNLAGAVK